jgi:deoxyribonuclease IV
MRLGAHNSIAGGLHHAVDEAVAIGADCMQIFCKNQRQWHAKPLSPTEVHVFRQAVEKAGIGPVMVHDAYLINMGTPDTTKWRTSYGSFLHELERCEALGIPYLNFHPGSHSHPDKKRRLEPGVRREALDRVASGLNQALDATPGGSTKLVIENAAGQGSNVGSSWEEVGYLADQVDDPTRLGVCVDTQHAWAAGYDWLQHYDAVWDEFDDQVGLKRLVAFHLNDSKQPCGARVDRHDSIGAGHLGEPFFRQLMTDARFANVAGYLETPVNSGLDYARELALLRAWSK